MYDGPERRSDAQNYGEAIVRLTSRAETIAKEAIQLRADIKKVSRRSWRTFAIVVLALILAGYLLFERKRDNKEANIRHSQNLALTVGVCAVQNVVRIEFANYLQEAQNRGIFDEVGGTPEQAAQKTAERDAYLDIGVARFGTLVPCEALVPKDEPNVNITLQYPDTVPKTESTTTVP